MTIPFRGGCACGRIRYECRAEPILAANRFHETTAEAGGPTRRGFCADCGSPLLIDEPLRPKIRLLQAASLDDPSPHRPTMSLFTSLAHPWAPLADGLPTFRAMPPIPESFGR